MALAGLKVALVALALDAGEGIVTMRIAVQAAALMVATAAMATEGPTILQPLGAPYAVGKGLQGEPKKHEDGFKKAKDVSGIACLPPSAGARRCLIVNDQNTGAQFVTLEGRAIAPGPVVELLGNAPSPATLGAPPSQHDCSGGDAEFSDLDGEGVAYAAPYFYVMGSHGCSRHANRFSLSSFILARFKEGGAAPGAVETTYRLSDALAAAGILTPYVAHDLQTDPSANGVNVEGVAVIGDRLFAGLRAPSLKGTAYILEAGVADLFAPGHDRMQAAPTLIPLTVGERAGIRDLSVLPDGRLLVLTGPAQEQDVPYELLAVEPKPGGKVETLGRLAPLEGDDNKGKAEAVAPLGDGRVLVLFDSLENGGPRDYALPR